MSAARIHNLPRPGGNCPICGKAPTSATLPFCSARCRDVDLSRWFGESYAIPSVEPDEDWSENQPRQIDADDV